MLTTINGQDIRLVIERNGVKYETNNSFSVSVDPVTGYSTIYATFDDGYGFNASKQGSAVGEWLVSIGNDSNNEWSVIGILLDSVSDPKSKSVTRSKVVYVDRVKIIGDYELSVDKIAPLPVVRKRKGTCNHDL